MSKKSPVRPSPTASPMNAATTVSPLDVVSAAVRVDDGHETAALMRLAERHLPDLVERGFEAGYIEDAARAVLNDSGDQLWLERAPIVESFLLTPGQDPTTAAAAGTVLYSVAAASFWLGVVAGQRLAGGGR